MRVAATERTCWHCADEHAARRLPPSGSVTVSVLLVRIMRVSGTTWTTLGPPLITRAAVRTIAGRATKPHHRPAYRDRARPRHPASASSQAVSVSLSSSARSRAMASWRSARMALRTVSSRHSGTGNRSSPRSEGGGGRPAASRHGCGSDWPGPHRTTRQSVPRAGSRSCRRGFRPGPVAATGGRSPVPGCWCGGTARCPRRRWPGPRRRCPRPTTRRPVRR